MVPPVSLASLTLPNSERRHRLLHSSTLVTFNLDLFRKKKQTFSVLLLGLQVSTYYSVNVQRMSTVLQGEVQSVYFYPEFRWLGQGRVLSLKPHVLL